MQAKKLISKRSMSSKFQIITDKISKATGINKNLFLFKLLEEEVYKDYSITEYKEHKISNHPFLAYQYRKNTKEKWHSISFRISREEAKDFQDIINPILKELNENELTLENFTKTISYDEDNFNYFTCSLKDGYFLLELAQKANKLKV